MQIANRMRRLHRRDDAKFLKAGNVERINDLRVFDAPARLGNLSLIRRHSAQRLLVLIKYEAITAITDRMRLALNAFAQSFFEHWQQIFFLDGQESGSVGRVGIWREQGRTP